MSRVVQSTTTVALLLATIAPLVGLGGGGAARLCSECGWKVDAVEIDPGVATLAVPRFRLQPLHARVTVGEGRRFPQRWRDAWDNRYRPDRGRVLTGEWNPVDLRAEEINLAARRALRAQLPDSLLDG
jgi:hypothetical protein